MNQMQHDFMGGPVARDFGGVLGTPFRVFLLNGVIEKTNEAGKIVAEITDLPGLISSIVQSRVLHPRKLSGDDLKYIRTALRMRSHEVADALDISAEHYSRCETGTKTLSATNEKFFRMYAFLEMGSRNSALVDDAIDQGAISPERAKEAMEAFRKVFFDMKVQHIYSVDSELEFRFCRRANQDVCCGDDDGKWRSGPASDAEAA